MGRISRTVQLAKASWRVLMADKELMLLPVISAAATLIAIATFVYPLVLSNPETFTEDASTGTWLVLVALYVLLAFITIFFNAALVSAANERLTGGDPTLKSALRGAARHVGAIFGWALVSATVSMILRALEERFEGLGRLFVGLLGAAWSLITFLVIPVLVIEGASVGDAMKRSGSMLKKTWGEQVAANIGFGLLGFVAAIPGFAIGAAGISAGGAAAAIGLTIAIVWVALVAVVTSTLSGIFQTALYHYAASGSVPGDYFSRDQMSQAFRPRRGRGGTWAG